nr:hypothetical protein [Tanacetum cinerariifolium]
RVPADQGVPADTSIPAVTGVSADATVPANQRVPADQGVPADTSIPAVTGVSADATVPANQRVPADQGFPADASIPADTYDPDAAHRVHITFASDDSDDDDTPHPIITGVHLLGWQVVPSGLRTIHNLLCHGGIRKTFTTLREILHMVDRQTL